MSTLLTINGGSSSIRFAFYAANDHPPAGTARPKKLLDGKIDRIGLPGTTLSVDGHDSALDATDHRSAVAFLADWLTAHPLFAAARAAGHRVVFGMQHAKPVRVTPELLSELKRLTPYDAEHLPREIELIEAIARLRPELPQVACFDTAFHRCMPRVATLIAVPRRYAVRGVQRYGFHGLSYTYLMAELERLAGSGAARGRVILAHLGNGASIAAVRDGRSIDTSMGFTPASGLVMSTRAGDLDPGLVSFLTAGGSMGPEAYQRMVTHESGLLGISETSSDIRDLLAREADDERAAEAVALFCYQAKKWIGGYAAALGGLDTLVFAGGIGENSAPVRARICAGLEFLGIELDEASNARGDALVSQQAAAVAVRVIRTDEESVIASSTLDAL